MKRKLAMGMLLAVAVLIVGCSKQNKNDALEQGNQTTIVQEQNTENANEAIITVNGQEISYDQLCLYLQSKKEEIENIYGKDVWSMKVDDEGTTYEQQFKEKVMEQLIYLKLVCSKAEELGVSLTEDELLDVNEYTAEFMSKFSEEALSYYKVSEEDVKSIYKDNVLANKVFENLTLNIDTNVTDEEAQQMDAAYIFISKHDYDNDGNKVQYSAKEIEVQRQRAGNLREKAIENDNFLELAKEYSDDDVYEVTLERGHLNKSLEDRVFALKSGQISEVLETAEGFFVFYCVNELNREATDAKKEEIIKEIQEEVFKTRYQEWYDTKKVSIDKARWDKISVKGAIVK